MVGDIAYEAQPGVGIYCSYHPHPTAYPCLQSTSETVENWQIMAGTSISAPAIAGLHAFAGNVGKGKGVDYPVILAYDNVLSYGYGAPLSAFFDITLRSNGPGGSASCDKDWLCDAEVRYDAPSGVGSPDGIGGF